MHTLRNAQIKVCRLSHAFDERMHASRSVGASVYCTPASKEAGVHIYIIGLHMC